MFEYLRFASVILLFPCLCVQGFDNFIRKHSSVEVNQTYGDITENIQTKVSEECVLSCLSQPDCKAALFSPHSGGHCLAVKSGMTFINATGYDYYTPERCADWRIADYSFLTRAGLPCPRVYLPLDEDTGTRMGSSPGDVQFVSGKVEGAFFNPNNSEAYYRLGYVHLLTFLALNGIKSQVLVPSQSGGW